MKRFFMLVAVVILSASWASPAQAQLGTGGLGGVSRPLDQTKAAQGQPKIENQQYLKAKPKAGRAQAARPFKSSYNYNYNSLDRFGRKDLAGRPVAGYPAIRGDIDSMKVSRGGANGSGARRSARRSK
jgi:hypothetical protein